MSNHEIDGDFLDRELSRKETLLPSSGFAASVMGAVRRDAATPPPMAFPWKRALPGIVGLFACMVWLATALARTHWTMSASAIPSIEAAALVASSRYQLGWIALALLVTLVTVKIAFRLGHASTTRS